MARKAEDKTKLAVGLVIVVLLIVVLLISYLPGTRTGKFASGSAEEVVWRGGEAYDFESKSTQKEGKDIVLSTGESYKWYIIEVTNGARFALKDVANENTDCTAPDIKYTDSLPHSIRSVPNYFCIKTKDGLYALVNYNFMGDKENELNYNIFTWQRQCSDADGDSYDLVGACGPIDCDDSNPNIKPGAEEICNGADDNCSHQIDEGCNDDKDNYCDASMKIAFGAPPCNAGGDCNDNDPLINPVAQETCDGVDNDCNGGIDEICDKDLDSYIDIMESCSGTPMCGAIRGNSFVYADAACQGCDAEFNTGTDCNDNSFIAYPGRDEACDNLDNNCDGQIDEVCDKDEDDFCDITKSISGVPAVCPKSVNYILDCNDDAFTVNPGMQDFCSSTGPAIDNDCDGAYDEDSDKDRDGHTICGTDPAGGGAVGEDCLDGDAQVYGGFSFTNEDGQIFDELCDGKDNDCDQVVDEGCDTDNDNYCDSRMSRVLPYKCSGTTECCPNPGGDRDDEDPKKYPAIEAEVCNGMDDNFDDDVDEGCDSDQDGYIDGIKGICSGTPKCSDDDPLTENLPATCHSCDELDCNDNLAGATIQNPGTGLYFKNGKCEPTCGDNIKAGQEGCDDSNTNDGDGCSAACIDERTLCGNGQIDTNANEKCDVGAKTTDYTDDVLNSKKCSDFTNEDGVAFSFGDLACNSDCKEFDTSKCVTEIKAISTSGTATLPSPGVFYFGDKLNYANSFYYAKDGDKIYITEMPNALVAVLLKLGCLFVPGPCDIQTDPIPLLASTGTGSCYKRSIDSPQNYGYDVGTTNFCFQIPKTKSFYQITGTPISGRASLSVSWTQQCPDYDSDGYGASGNDLAACEQTTADCNDFESTAYEGAIEFCDAVDNDCNPSTKDGSGETYYEPEEITCDSLDNDCDSLVDEGRPAGTTLSPFEGGACTTVTECGIDRTDCTQFAGVGVEATACVPKFTNNKYSNQCQIQCQDSYTQCGTSCYQPTNGQCTNSQWACNSGFRLNQDTNGCEEFCNPSETRDCYTGPADTDGVGVCRKGTQTCNIQQAWGSCSRQVQPTGEVCDGEDDDCDGLLDDGADGRLGSVCINNDDCGTAHVNCVALYETDASKNIDTIACIASQCKLLACNIGFEDANNNLADGCEKVLPRGCTDFDRDNYKVPFGGETQCGPLDCDDRNGKLNPGRTEACNSIDDNCDGKTDQDAYGAPVFETKSCGVGICAGGTQTRECSDGGFGEWGACEGASVQPTTELCNKLDDNCDGFVDEPFDADKDGIPANVTACTQAYAGTPLDCNDNSAGVRPGAAEVCNGADDNCDGIADNIDGSINPSETGCACSGQSAAKIVQTKKHREELNKIDDNCDGKLDSKELDRDLDGFAVYEKDCNDKDDQINPEARELCSDKKDNNCDGVVNEGCDKKALSVFDQALAPPVENITEAPLAPEAPAEEPLTGLEPTEPIGGREAEEPSIVSDATGAEFAEPEGGTNFTLIAAIIAVLMIAGSVGFLFWRRQQTDALSSDAESFNVAEPTTEAPPREVKQNMSDFISSSVSQGYSATNIKQTLKEKGWSEEDVASAMEETAKSIEHLNKAAVEKGLSPDKEAGLKGYISEMKRKGFSKEQVKAALINGGWEKEAVEKYM